MKVRVPLKERAYDVVIREGVLRDLVRLTGAARGTRVAVVGDRRLGKTLTQLARAFEAYGNPAMTIALPADERLKSLRSVEPLYGKLLRAGLDRRATIVGVGGGTIGDAIGFVAATYLRGIRFISVPTTLLADVDSSIGGKTGLNHDLGKNLIGVVAQPNLVVIDPSILRGLDRRDRISGLGEIVKSALIADARMFRTLQTSWKDVVALREPLTTRIIARCVAIKARIVASDERERTGVREQLNFGHTVAHALENVAGYGTLRHGEAVIVGMRAAVALSAAREHLRDLEARAIQKLLQSIPVPDTWQGYSARSIAAAAKHDKKRGAKGVRFVLLAKIGRTISDEGVSQELLLDALRRIGFAR